MSINGTWMQSAVIVLLALIALGTAWGHLEGRQTADHDLLLEVRNEARTTRHEMLNAMSDLQDEVHSLRSEISDLENRIVRLETRQEIERIQGITP